MALTIKLIHRVEKGRDLGSSDIKAKDNEGYRMDHSNLKVLAKFGHLGLGFFSEVSINSISCCCYFIFNILTLEVGWLHLDML